MNRIRLTFLMALLCVAHRATAAEDIRWGFDAAAVEIPNVLYSSDSEGFHAQKISAGIYPLYDHGDHYLGLRAGAQQFSQHGWQSNGMLYTLTARDISLKTGIGYTADLGLSTQGGHTLLTTDSSWGMRLGPTTGAELFINRDWVESQNALTRGISHSFVGGSLEQQLAPGVRVVGVLGEQFFSDGNSRHHERIKLIYDVLPDYGVTVQGRLRLYQSSDEDVNSAYFNPQRYREEMVAIGWRKRAEGWMFNSTVGIGQQHINADPATATRLVQLEVTSPKKGNIYLRAHANYSESAGVNGPNYRYRGVQAALVFEY